MTRNPYCAPVIKELGGAVHGTQGAFNGSLEVGMKKP
jgi:hypothetical protein